MPTATKRKIDIPASPDYGVDEPHVQRQWLIRGIVVFALGAGFYFMNTQNNPRGGAALFIALGVLGAAFAAVSGIMYWSSRKGKLRVRDEMLDAIPWRGDEKVLDIGCGRGLMLIGAAKRIRGASKAVGIDLWRPEDLSGNSQEAVTANARAEGVFDRIKIDTGDARKLPYQPNTFDVVLASLALHNIQGDDERRRAVEEIWRVAKPGGHIAIFDFISTRHYRGIFEKLGAEVVAQSKWMMLWARPCRWFVARKTAA
jgi:arsenite methyltransferase